MLKKVIIFLFFPLSFSAHLCCAEALENTSNVSEIRSVIDKIQRHTLSNGLRVLILPRHEVPVFSAVTAVQVGGTDELPPKTGISHMLEHMAFKGTSTIGTKDFEREKKLLDELEVLELKQSSGVVDSQRIQEIFSELSKLSDGEAYSRELNLRGAVGLNASTDNEFTTYTVKLPTSALAYWAWAESERLKEPVMREFYKERDVVREERRMRIDNEPSGKLYEKFIGTAFTVHPYKFPVIGYDDDIKNLHASDLVSFHKKYYIPSNIVVALIGDVGEKDIDTLEQYLGTIPSASEFTRIIPHEPPQTEQREVTVETDHSPLLFMGYKKPHYPDPDDAKLTVLGKILAGGRLSKLHKKLVEERQVAIDVDYTEVPGIVYPNLFFFGATPKGDTSAHELLRIFDEALLESVEEGFTEDDIELAQRQITKEYLGMVSKGLEFAELLAQTELSFKSYTTLLNWYDESMKVTPAELKNLSEKYLRKEIRTIGFLETKKGGTS